MPIHSRSSGGENSPLTLQMRSGPTLCSALTQVFQTWSSEHCLRPRNSNLLTPISSVQNCTWHLSSAQLSAGFNAGKGSVVKELCSVPGLFLRSVRSCWCRAEPANLGGVLVISQIRSIQGSECWPFPWGVWSPVDTLESFGKRWGNLGFRVRHSCI